MSFFIFSLRRAQGTTAQRSTSLLVCLHSHQLTKGPCITSNMPLPTTESAALSDFDKLRQALSFLQFTSLTSWFGTLGLADLPRAQRYGILFGFLTFVSTIIAVFVLLMLGGSFNRIKEQAKNGGKPLLPEIIQMRKNRPLLLERLLEARDWMLRTNYPDRCAEPSCK